MRENVYEERENVYEELPALMGVIAHHTDEFPDFFGVTYQF